MLTLKILFHKLVIFWLQYLGVMQIPRLLPAVLPQEMDMIWCMTMCTEAAELQQLHWGGENLPGWSRNTACDQ